MRPELTGRGMALEGWLGRIRVAVRGWSRVAVALFSCVGGHGGRLCRAHVGDNAERRGCEGLACSRGCQAVGYGPEGLADVSNEDGGGIGLGFDHGKAAEVGHAARMHGRSGQFCNKRVGSRQRRWRAAACAALGAV